MRLFTLTFVTLCIAVAGVSARRGWWWHFFTTRSPVVTTAANNNGISCGLNGYSGRSGDVHGIVGGSDAFANEFPWQAQVIYGGSYICGASVISDRHILTAAHCIPSRRARNYQVHLGDHNRHRREQGERTYAISNVIVHPSYSSSSNRFDFAVLVTSNKIAFDRQFVRPVCLPNSAGVNALVGQTGVISGWGKLSEGGPGSVTLQKAYVPVLSQSDCQRSYGSITSDMVCAGYQSGGVDSCQGDSGGPLVVPSNGRYYLQGVTSWGYGCARRNYPGVYARVTAAIDWIKSTMAST